MNSEQSACLRSQVWPRSCELNVVWEQIEEDVEDYQYFKQYDNELLEKQMEAVKKNGSINIT